MHSNVRSSNNLDDGYCETVGACVYGILYFVHCVCVQAADELVKNEALSELEDISFFGSDDHRGM